MVVRVDFSIATSGIGRQATIEVGFLDVTQERRWCVWKLRAGVVTTSEDIT